MKYAQIGTITQAIPRFHANGIHIYMSYKLDSCVTSLPVSNHLHFNLGDSDSRQRFINLIKEFSSKFDCEELITTLNNIGNDQEKLKEAFDERISLIGKPIGLQLVK